MDSKFKQLLEVRKEQKETQEESIQELNAGLQAIQHVKEDFSWQKGIMRRILNIAKNKDVAPQVDVPPAPLHHEKWRIPPPPRDLILHGHNVVDPSAADRGTYV